jgi:hypothetical protein
LRSESAIVEGTSGEIVYSLVHYKSFTQELEAATDLQIRNLIIISIF